MIKSFNSYDVYYFLLLFIVRHRIALSLPLRCPHGLPPLRRNMLLRLHRLGPHRLCRLQLGLRHYRRQGQSRIGLLRILVAIPDGWMERIVAVVVCFYGVCYERMQWGGRV